MPQSVCQLHYQDTRLAMPHPAARRLQIACELHDLGVAMMKQRLRREHPDEADAEIQTRLGAWLQERPGAELGDGVGVPVPWPRPPR